MNVGVALAAAAEIGPFFQVRQIPHDALDPAHTLARLYTDGPTLAARVRATADRLKVHDPRVAGSIFFQGLAAKLWSPTLAIAGQQHRVLLLHPDVTGLDDAGLVCANPVLSEVFETEPGEPNRCAVPAEALARAVVDTHLAPLADALRVPATTLWGNATSAVIGSHQVLSGVRPDLADAGLIRALLRVDRLDGTGRLDDSGRFQRESCCLFYRVPGGGLCGDCVLHRRLSRRPPGR